MLENIFRPQKSRDFIWPNWKIQNSFSLLIYLSSWPVFKIHENHQKAKPFNISIGSFFVPMLNNA